MSIAVEAQLAVPAHVPADRVVDFDFLSDAGLSSDPHAVYMRLAGAPPLVFTPRNGGHWIATNRAVMTQIFQSPELFSNFPRVIPKTASLAKPHAFSDIDPPDNAKYRVLAQKALNPCAAKSFEAQAHEVIIELTQKVQRQGACEFVADIAKQFPIVILLRWLGLPYADRDELMERADDVLGGAKPDLRKKAKETIVAYAAAVVADRKSRPSDDMISQIVHGLVGGRAVSDEEALAMTTNLIIGGLDTVRNMLGFIAGFLATHPEHRRQLVAEPSLIGEAVEEFLRWFAIPNMSRSVKSDAEIGGAVLKQGEMVLLPLVLAGRDPAAYQNAGEVDFRRADKRHISFGVGAHLCLGMYLARIELKAFLEEWLKRIPDFALDPADSVRTHGGIILSMCRLPLVWLAA